MPSTWSKSTCGQPAAQVGCSAPAERGVKPYVAMGHTPAPAEEEERTDRVLRSHLEDVEHGRLDHAALEIVLRSTHLEVKRAAAVHHLAPLTRTHQATGAASRAANPNEDIPHSWIGHVIRGRAQISIGPRYVSCYNTQSTRFDISYLAPSITEHCTLDWASRRTEATRTAPKAHITILQLAKRIVIGAQYVCFSAPIVLQRSHAWRVGADGSWGRKVRVGWG